MPKKCTVLIFLIICVGYYFRRVLKESETVFQIFNSLKFITCLNCLPF